MKMKYRLTSNTKNIGKRNAYFNKPLLIKLNDGIIEKRYEIKPGEFIDIVVYSKYEFPWNVCELQKKDLLKISTLYNIEFKPIDNEVDEINFLKEVSDKIKELSTEPIADIGPMRDYDLSEANEFTPK